MTKKELLSRFSFIPCSMGLYRVIYDDKKHSYICLIYDMELIANVHRVLNPKYKDLLILRNIVKCKGNKINVK